MRRISNILFGSAFILIGSVLAACDATSTNVEDSEPVVEAYLVGDAPLPSIRLSRTEEISAGYSPSALAIRDATVRVRLEGLEGAQDVFYDYVHNADRPGIYEPETGDAVISGRTYHLDAQIESSSESITASTTVPTSFTIERITADTVVFQGDVQYSVDITDSSFPGRESIYIQSILAIEPDPCELTPLYLLDVYDVEEGDDYDCTTFDPEEVDYLLKNSSPPLNEQSYEFNPDGSIRVSLPWFAVAFYGQSEVGTAAIDNALYDYIRYQNVQQDGGTLSPGEIPNVLDNIDGGRGVFGSMSQVSSIMTVVR